MKLKNWHIAGIIFTLILGTLLHFTYAWSGENAIVGLFSAVNESTWEHLKLLFTPMFLFAVFEYFTYGKQIPNFIPVKFLSILLGMITIVLSFYTYVGVIGQNFLWADIGTFILGVLVAYWFSYKLLQTNYFSSPGAIQIAKIGIMVLLFCVIVFTFQPPHIALFQDPLLGTYGK